METNSYEPVHYFFLLQHHILLQSESQKLFYMQMYTEISMVFYSVKLKVLNKRQKTSA